MVPPLTSRVGWRPPLPAARPAAELVTLLLVLLAGVWFGASIAAAAPISSDRIGVNVFPASSNGQLLFPNDLGTASAAGIGRTRIQMIQGINHDPVFALTAAAHVRVSPMLGLPQQLSPSDAASAMAQYVTAFAQRYGPGGTFWSQNPQLPYLPVDRFEIGNEPNMPLQWVADNVHLHWTDPSAYAQVYSAARAALHQVDPSGIAVVGGLADSDGGGVDVPSVERWLAALPGGGVDEVGFHPYVSPTMLRPDTEALHQWMDANGFADVPLDINELDACYPTPQTTMNSVCGPVDSYSDWGSAVSQFAQWALCRSDLNVANVQVFYWGDDPWSDRDAFLHLVTAEGTLTPYGQDYLAAAQTLTTRGCPPENASLPTISGAAVVGQVLSGAPGSWSPTPTSLTYQWNRCDASGQNCFAVPGATSPSYPVQSADAGHTMVLSVTAANSVGSTTASSLPAGMVPAPQPGASSSSSGASSSTGATGTASQPRPRHQTAAHSSRTRFIRAGVASLRPRRRFRVQWIRGRGRWVTVAVRVMFPAPQMGVSARRNLRHVRLRVVRGGVPSVAQPSGNSKVLLFSGALRGGRWVISVRCVSRCANQSIVPLRVTVLVPRLAIAW